MPSYLNAYADGSNLYLVRRVRGVVTVERTLAEYVSWYRAYEVKPELLRSIRTSSSIRSVKVQGEWLRVGWRDDQTRRAMVGAGEGPLAGIEAFEGDVDPVRLWLTESGAEVARPRRAFLDLETDSDKSFAEARRGKSRILSWAVTDESGLRRCNVLEEDTDAAEHALVASLWKLLGAYDQVAAWNLDGFDAPVLWGRTRHHRIKMDHRRWLWCDHRAVFQRMNVAKSGDEKQSMKLEDIAQAVLGRGKISDPGIVPGKVLGAQTREMWDAGGEWRAKMVRYNVVDAELLRDIERETGYLAVFATLCEACRVFGNTDGLNPTAQLDGFLLRLGHERGQRFPTRAHRDEQEKYKGAYVMHPKRKGILRNVHVADFSSMYPSIILTWNMSPESLAAIPVNGPIPAGYARAPTTGAGFNLGVVGLLVEALRELLRLRKFWSDKKAQCAPGTPEWHDADRRSTAYKVAANSFYGVVGSIFSRFFNKLIASSVTGTGEWLLKQIISASDARDFWEALYGDSVTGDRVLVTRSPTDEVTLLTAEELWSQASAVVVGLKQRGRLPGWFALTEKGWSPIEQIIRHRARKPTWRLTTKHGQTEVTEDHGIMCDGEKTRPAEFLRGRRTFTAVDAPSERPLDRVDLFSFVEGFSYRFRSRGHDYERRFVLAGNDHFFLGGWGNPEKNLRIRRWYERGSAEMHSLLRLIGLYVGDGSASLRGVTNKHRSALSFCKADASVMRIVVRDLMTISPGVKVFGPYWSDTVYVVRASTIAMAGLFSQVCGHKSRGKKLPSFAFHLDRHDREVLVGALTMGDGYVDAAGQLSYTTNSQKLASGASYLLSQHGRPHGWSYRESKGAWKLRTRGGKERPSRYSIKAEVGEPTDEWVYDLSVRDAHTFVDGIGRVLLHNTDSVMVTGPTDEEFAAFVAWCNEELIPGLVAKQGCRENHVKIAYEKKFERIVIVSAKRYCGRFAHWKGTAATADSEPEVKGLEYKRGDAGVLARRLQAEVIDLLVGGLKVARVPVPTERLEDYHEAVGRMREHVLNAQLPSKEVVLSKSLSQGLGSYAQKTKKDGKPAAQPAHVVIAKMLKGRGRTVEAGDRVEYVVSDATAEPTGLIPSEDYDGTNVDRFHLWENIVFPPTQRLLEAAFPMHDWEAWRKVRPRKVRAAKKPVQQAELFSLGVPKQKKSKAIGA